mmetsp:Transcript_2200/g.7374  ORF Transcript_2200/g.7374 Transcript_2200/m.7374 type:complete len:473 (+) Transcript_2200:86-1504(+)
MPLARAALLLPLLAASGNRVGDDLDSGSGADAAEASDALAGPEDRYWASDGYPVAFLYTCIARDRLSKSDKGVNISVLDAAMCYEWRNRHSKYYGNEAGTGNLDPLLGPICGTAGPAHKARRTDTNLTMSGACQKVKDDMDPEERGVLHDVFSQVFEHFFALHEARRPQPRPAVLMALGPGVEDISSNVEMGRAFAQLSPALAWRNLTFSDFAQDRLATVLKSDARYTRMERLMTEVSKSFLTLEEAIPEAKTSTEAVGNSVVSDGRSLMTNLFVHMWGDGTARSWRRSDVYKIIREKHAIDAVNAAADALLARRVPFVFTPDMADATLKFQIPKFREAEFHVEGYFPMVPLHELMRRAVKRADKFGSRTSGEEYFRRQTAYAQDRLLELLSDANRTDVPPLFDAFTMITRFSPNRTLQGGNAGFVALQFDGHRRCLVRPCGPAHVFRAFDLPRLIGCAGLPLCRGADWRLG